MKKHHIFAIGLVAVALGLLTWLWYWHSRKVVPAPALVSAPAAVGKPLLEQAHTSIAKTAGGIPPKPRLFKSKEYPPKSPEVQAMWDWWLAMDKADHSFQWKMPIEFYGIVLDQFDQPVAGADVSMTWTTVGGTRTNKIRSGGDGKFVLLNANGKCLTVEVLKLGYARTKSGFLGFEYASFSDENFHVPDSATPVVFRVQKLIKPEPLYKYNLCRDVSLDGPPLLLDPATGKTGKGDFAFSVTLGSGRGRYGSDYTVTIQATGRAGFALSNEEFLFSAPESGYQSTVSYSEMVSNPNYRTSKKIRFYGKTSAGKYAAIEVEISVFDQKREAEIVAIIYYNPSGSRNLELDDKMLLNRWAR